FLDLADVLQGAAIPSAPVLAVFDNDMDEQAHKGPEQFPGLVGPFVLRLKRAIGRLHDSGVEAVHLVTDHGFLFLPPALVETLGQPEVPAAQAYYRGARWAALKPGAPTTEVMRWPLPLAPQAVDLGIPRGARTLQKAAEAFPGLVVRTDLLRRLRSAYSVPIFVIEFL